MQLQKKHGIQPQRVEGNREKSATPSTCIVIPTMKLLSMGPTAIFEIGLMYKDNS
jgi:hypothetical protein